MHFFDYILFALYMLVVLGIGFYFFRRNKDAADYYVGGRSVGASHVGLSIVATDVGGGFSIGLGGLGYLIGLSGSWLLFTGLLGAWLSAVWIIPRIKALDARHNMLTYPDFLRLKYNPNVALMAALISGIGYLGFTGAQVLAGAKLMSATVVMEAPFDMSPLAFSLYVIGAIIIGYTVLGGLKAVIYTDTVQWIILLSGLIFLGIPFALVKIGGWSVLRDHLPDTHFSLTNITPVMFVNWLVTIVPIWLVGMTLYQRMYACRDVREAQRAWYIAGFFEYPVMAFVGVFLGLCGRAYFSINAMKIQVGHMLSGTFGSAWIPAVDAEAAVPLLIKLVLPVGATGIVVAAYFSAIMSTADSCLMASSGNFVNDLLRRLIRRDLSDRAAIRISQLATLLIGLAAVILAGSFRTVLDGILYAYAFMVAGLFVPTLGAYFWPGRSPAGARMGMLAGGSLTLLLILWGPPLRLDLDPAFFGIVASLIGFVLGSRFFPARVSNPTAPAHVRTPAHSPAADQ